MTWRVRMRMFFCKTKRFQHALPPQHEAFVHMARENVTCCACSVYSCGELNEVCHFLSPILQCPSCFVTQFLHASSQKCCVVGLTGIFVGPPSNHL